MRKRWVLSVLITALLLCGCAKSGTDISGHTEADETTEVTSAPTTPADGNPGDITCKGSYTGTEKNTTMVAMCDTGGLTNEQLQVWYWAEVSRYRQENREAMPDFTKPLETQICEIDSSVNSWQQYFLKQALSSWHRAQALIAHSQAVPLPTEEAYQPDPAKTERYMTGMPASEVLYGYYSYYRPNSMHQDYLDGIVQRLEDMAREKGYGTAKEMAAEVFGTSQTALETVVHTYNLGYMYFTHLSHSIEPTAEQLDAFYEERGSADSDAGISVDFRQILLLPDETDGAATWSEEAWAACEEKARKIVNDWWFNTDRTEVTFGESARKLSQDSGTKVNGGHYRDIRKGQMTKVIDDWCFDPVRQPGDLAVLRSSCGVHILYFSGSESIDREESDREYYRRRQLALIDEAKDMFPMEVTYSAISLQEAQGGISIADMLYPDIAHERFPEVPLYLQQDYPKTMYGGFPIRTNGCGITSFAMVASYLTDNELTPPEMCALYGRYSHANGTDGLIFNKESAVQGFYLREKTYDNRLAKTALEEGYLVVSIQHPGYWTRGGHYIVCEKINEEGMVQVRDSNIYNYTNIRAHAQDLHKWGHIITAGSGYWIFEHKVTRIPACSRCGVPEEATEGLLNGDYICEKCGPALLRRSTYLNA